MKIHKAPQAHSKWLAELTPSQDGIFWFSKAICEDQEGRNKF
ncbi:MAG: hypothetical protein ACQEWD_15470 [Bacteroidota bacterium]